MKLRQEPSQPPPAGPWALAGLPAVQFILRGSFPVGAALRPCTGLKGGGRGNASLAFFRQQTLRASVRKAHYVLGSELGAGKQEGHCPCPQGAPSCSYAVLITSQTVNNKQEKGERGGRKREELARRKGCGQERPRERMKQKIRLSE